MTAKLRNPAPGVFLSLVIPAYNESAGIAQAIAEADQALAALGYRYEILVVDDGSADDTFAAADQARTGRPRVRVLQHAQNIGYGAALRTGFEAARGQLVAFTDADCQFDLHDLAKLIPLANQFPVVAGYRMQRQDPWQRCLFSRGYNLLARTLLGTRVRDCDCALKVFRRDALGQILPNTNGFFVNSEMLTRARQQGLAITEVGVRHRPRVRGCSKVSLLDIPRTLRSFLPFWWSQVMFPGAAACGEAGDLLHRKRLVTPFLVQFLLLLLLSSLMFFTRLSTPLLEPEEARYAEIPRQMLAEGRFAAPVLHGEPYYQKPPLLYWLVMTCYQFCGVHDWAARLVPGFTGVALILLVYIWGRRILGDQAAFLAGLILCLSARFVYLSRLLTLDSVLALCVVAALLAGYRAGCGQRFSRGWWQLSALFCGFGLHTKGPVALALVVMPLLVFSRLDRRVARPGLRGWAGFFAVVCGVAAPWYVAMAVANPEAASDFFLFHNFARFVAPFDHSRPLWFFLPEVSIGLFPWSLLMFPLVRHLLQKDKNAAAQRSPALGFFLLAFCWCLFFFSCSGCKRSVYLLPALPLLAIGLGSYLAQTLPWRTLTWRSVPVLRLPVRSAWTCGVLLLAGLQITAIWQLLPEYHRRASLRGQVRRFAAWCNQEQLPVLCYPRLWDSVSFYLQSDKVQACSPAETPKMIHGLKSKTPTLVFIKSDKAMKQFLTALPHSLEFVPCGRQGKLHVGMVHPRAAWTAWKTPADLAKGNW